MSIAVVIVGAGRGRRLGGDIPKQYIPLGGRTSLRRVIDTFLSEGLIDWIVPVIHPDDLALYQKSSAGLDNGRVLLPVYGSDTRARSVRKGLERLEPLGPEKVLIHDAARPFMTPEVVTRVVAALENNNGACAALPVVDALWKAENNTANSQVPREGLWRAQTPQGFSYAIALAAHKAHDGFGADDVAVAKEFGVKVELVAGCEKNYKVTTSPDLSRAMLDVEILDRASTTVRKNASVRVL
ncbi:2-C-methyl-D-erythritol 4-phosphate cytidylyltransferase [Octadecabacter sp.]|nr:2-C-methyl-D-erythritol 4-phosphate cytidylyltransferase [Octadecabacter sp.]